MEEENWMNLLVDDNDNNNDLFIFGGGGGGEKSSSCSSTSTSIIDYSPLSDIEQHLFNEDYALVDDDVDRFIHEFLLDSPTTQTGGQVVDNQQQQQPEPDAVVVVVDDDHNEVEQKEHDNSDDNNDPLAKKRKRQLRNKDAALRSRERKKEYVKELEMKSRYYEGECRRLGSLLQCVMAENQALRFSMHSTSSNHAFNASMTRQESAVLFLESLLLGSLLWLMGIVCQLVVLPQQSQSQQLVEEKPLPKSCLLLRKLGSEIRRQTHLLMGKPFKASRSRMRHSLQADVSSNILLSVF